MKFLRALRTLAAYFVVMAFIVICLGNQITSSQGRENTRNELYEKLDIFASVLSLIQNSYVEQVSSKDLILGALEGTLSSLDPYSQFLKPELYKEIQIETDGEFGGLGIEIVVKENILVVVSALPGTPAARVGLRPDDRIIRIDGEMIDDLHAAVNKLRGPVNTKVEITIFRPSVKQYYNLELVREKIKIDSVVDVCMLPKTSVGYIRIIQFQSGTAQDFIKSLEKLEGQNIHGLIIDLRNNPGGLLDEAIRVAGVLIGEKNLVVYTQGRLPEQNVKKFSEEKFHPISYPVVILVNRGSASGSEVVAGAVQDWKKGIILGETSFGKASVQSLIPLKDGSAVRLTTARYYTPKGRLIHEKGIEPDVEVKLTKEDILVFDELQRKSPQERSEDVYLDAQILRAVTVITESNQSSEKQTVTPPDSRLSQ
ncbi:MAG: S41 family peptidase [Candidatus Aureabacteria bacterium]|nr:S41 family peptidase [Candidatus Auribacterota bacterium]